MKIFRAVALASVAMGFASVSQAGFIALDSTGPAMTNYEIATNNNFRSSLAGLDITNYATGASLGTDVSGSVTFYYYGKEAGYRNDFAASGLSYSTGYSPYQDHFGAPLEIGTIAVGAGLLDFGFCSFSGGTSVGCVSNAQNDARGMWSVQSIAMSISSDAAWLFWDDSGAGPDDNHDDMLIKAVFRPTSVPEPASGALIGLGLLAMGVGRRFARR
jgi:PEP-CTERM motif